MNRLAQKKRVALDQLGRLELLGLDDRSGVRRQIERLAKQRDVTLRFSIEVAGWFAAWACAKEGIGVALIPRDVAERHSKSGLVIRDVEPSRAIHHALIWRRDVQADEVLAAREALQQVVS